MCDLLSNEQVAHFLNVPITGLKNAYLLRKGDIVFTMKQITINNRMGWFIDDDNGARVLNDFFLEELGDDWKVQAFLDFSS